MLIRITPIPTPPLMESDFIDLIKRFKNLPKPLPKKVKEVLFKQFAEYTEYWESVAYQGYHHEIKEVAFYALN